jgi:thiamine pyrophosphate-dependent acetolactate synthase large subunit-like protein
MGKEMTLAPNIIALLDKVIYPDDEPHRHIIRASQCIGDTDAAIEEATKYIVGKKALSILAGARITLSEAWDEVDRTKEELGIEWFS